MANQPDLNIDDISRLVKNDVTYRHPDVVMPEDTTWLDSSVDKTLDRLSPLAIRTIAKAGMRDKYKAEIAKQSKFVNDKLREIHDGDVPLSFDLGLDNYVVKIPLESFEQGKRAKHKVMRVYLATIDDWAALADYEKAAADSDHKARLEKCEGISRFIEFLKSHGVDTYGDGVKQAEDSAA